MARFFGALFLLAAIALVQAKLRQDEIDALTNNFIEQIRPYKTEIQDWALGIALDRPESKADYLNCNVCHPALTIARPILEHGTEQELTDAIARVCMMLGLAPSNEICKPTIEGYVTPIAYMLRNNPSMSNDDFCGMINENCGTVNPEFYNWETQIAPGKPNSVERPPLPTDTESIKILQFTDLHLDLDYEVGTRTDCKLPICCRKKDGKPTDGKPGAGVFGHGKCGLPYAGMEAMYKHARDEHGNAKYILLTGDYIHSGVWLYNRTENERHISTVTETLHKFFPKTTVIVVTGNHETPTVNMYPPPSVTDEKFSLTWMYEAMSEPFKDYMGGPGQIADFRRGGFYTVSPEPGLRFVIINSNICYIQNFWLPHDPIDPFGHLKWLSRTMAKAEKAKEKVLVIGHIPPGTGACWTHWSNQFDRIIKRYAHIIPFQVYGHTHNEFYAVTLETDVPNKPKPTSVSFMGPSAVAEGAGVAYKVYYVDGARGEESTWELMDHETWMLNTTKSHSNGNKADWYMEFRASEAFGLKAQRPEDYYNLTLRMMDDQDLFEKFRRYFRKDNNDENYEYCETVDCVSEIICHTVNYNAADRSICNKLKSILENLNQNGGGDGGEGSGAFAFKSSIITIFSMTILRQLFVQ